MILLNVSFGVMIFTPFGWISIILVLLLESGLAAYLLEKKLFSKSIYGTITLSNFISGLAGLFVSLALNGGWWLVFWIPIVGEWEVGKNKDEFIVYYICAFIASVFIETLINLIFWTKKYGLSKTVKTTFTVNCASYLISSVLLYSYTFG